MNVKDLNVKIMEEPQYDRRFMNIARTEKFVVNKA
jgi:hypothetical protein